MEEREERIIDGVKLIGWPATIVKRLEDVEVKVNGFLSKLADVEKDIAGLKTKLAKIVKMTR